MNWFSAMDSLHTDTKSCYVLVGEEPFQIELFLEKIRAQYLITPEDRDFFFESFDGEGLDLQNFRQALQSLPGLLAPSRERRLVFCRRFEKAPAGATEILEAYLQDPEPPACLVLVTSKIDGRKSWAKKLETKAIILPTEEPYERDWQKWQTFLQSRHGKRLSARGWQLLWEAAGRKLASVASEYEKLVLFADSKSELDIEEVQQVCVPPDSADVFEFAECVLAGRRTQALAMYERLQRSGESEIKLLALLVRHYRQLRDCQHWISKGILENKKLGSLIGVHPFFVPKLIGAARQIEESRLDECLTFLAKADCELKRGNQDLYHEFLLPFLGTLKAS